MTKHMDFQRPVMIVEDGRDDQDLILACIRDINPQYLTRIFKNGREALDYLSDTTEQPFAILADIMMPVMNGLELLKTINDDPYLHQKAIPFIFLTSAVSQAIVREAYHLLVQGFFVKAATYGGLREQINLCLQYWEQCRHPNNIQ